MVVQCVRVLLPLKLSVHKSSRSSDLKKHVCVYVVCNHDPGPSVLESPILGVQTVSESRVNILVSDDRVEFVPGLTPSSYSSLSDVHESMGFFRNQTNTFYLLPY